MDGKAVSRGYPATPRMNDKEDVFGDSALPKKLDTKFGNERMMSMIRFVPVSQV
jgi:hypothetical protein